MAAATQTTAQRKPQSRVKDARGRVVSQLDPVTMHLLRRRDVIPPDVVREIARQVGIGMTRAMRVVFWAGVVSVVCLGIALIILLTRLHGGTIGIGKFVRSLLPYCGVWVAPWAFWMGTRNVRRQRITKVMLARRRCPHCGYDIRLLPVDRADGATVCPECGCAWMLEASTAVDTSGSTSANVPGASPPPDEEEHGNG